MSLTNAWIVPDCGTVLAWLAASSIAVNRQCRITTAWTLHNACSAKMRNSHSSSSNTIVYEPRCRVGLLLLGVNKLHVFSCWEVRRPASGPMRNFSAAEERSLVRWFKVSYRPWRRACWPWWSQRHNLKAKAFKHMARADTQYVWQSDRIGNKLNFDCFCSVIHLHVNYY